MAAGSPCKPRYHPSRPPPILEIIVLESYKVKKVAADFVKPNGMTRNSNAPYRVTPVVFCSLPCLVCKTYVVLKYVRITVYFFKIQIIWQYSLEDVSNFVLGTSYVKSLRSPLILIVVLHLVSKCKQELSSSIAFAE